VASVFFYISGHGLGHAARQIEIVNALGGMLGGRAGIVIRSSAAPWIFERTVKVPYVLLDQPVDTGVVQIDSLHLDERATVAAAAAFYADLESRAIQEAAALRAHDARLVVSDAPPLGCAAAAAAGIPSVVCTNFTWDWIYEGYDLSGAPTLLATIQDAYRQAAGGWRLPMYGGFETVAPIVDVPFVARHARHAAADVRRRLGLPEGRPLMLLSFGGYGLSGLDLSRIDCLDRIGLVVTVSDRDAGPAAPGIHVVPESAIYGNGFRYEDLVAAVDVVVTKPGYGIIAECVANDAAILYTSRGRFVEYDVLVAEMPRYLRSRYIDHEALFAGRWGETVDRLLAAPPPPERPRTDGADVVAGLIDQTLNDER
jgi:L-arabinokinase